MDIINLPYCFLFIPLFFSGLNILQNHKSTNMIIGISVVSFILGLSLFLLPEVLPNYVIKNEVDNNILFLMGEYRLNLSNLSFIILIFFTKLILFMFFDDNLINTKKLNFFYAIYLINYFAICGILTSNNIFNIYIYTELYSFSLYNLMSDYKQLNSTKIAYKYYNSGVLGSIFFMFFTFIVFFTFGTPNIDYIANNLDIIRDNYVYNLSLIIFIIALFFKFFSFNFYFNSISKASQVANLLFINILFSDIIIGIYLFYKFLFSLFDIYIIFERYYFDVILFLFGSCLIIYNSYKLFYRKNLLPTIYSFSLIMIGYILILIGMNNEYSFVAIFSLLINHVLVDFLFYVIVALLIYIFKRSDTPILYSFYKYRYIMYIILLSKLCFPIAFGFNSSWNYILSVIVNKNYFLFIPFFVEKICLILLFNRYYFIFYKESSNTNHPYLILDNRISIKTNYMLAIMLIFGLIILISFFEGSISNILFNFFNLR